MSVFTLILIFALVLFLFYSFVRCCLPSSPYVNAFSRVEFSIDKFLRNFITGVLFLRQDIAPEEVVSLLAERLSHIRHFTHRVVRNRFWWPYFKPIASGHEKFDFGQVVKELNLSDILDESESESESGSESLREKIEEGLTVISTWVLDPNLPLFRFFVVHVDVLQDSAEGEEEDSPKALIVLQLHHGIADAYASLGLLFNLTERNDREIDESESEMNPLPPKKPFVPPPKPGFCGLICSFLKALVKILAFPVDSNQMVLSYREGRHSPDIVFPQVYYTGKSCEESPFLSVHEAKRVARTYGVTVNDVLTSAVSGGFRTFMRRNGTPFDAECVGTVDGEETESEKSPLHTVTWVNLRPESLPALIRRLSDEQTHHPEERSIVESSYGVNIGCVMHEVLVNIASPVERMQRCNALLKSMYHTPEPLITKLILLTIGLLPPVLCQPLFAAVGFKTSLSISNVLGPSYEQSFCGREVSSIAFFVTPDGTVSNMVTLYSYAGKLVVAIQGVRSIQHHRELMSCVVDSVQEHLAL